MIDPIRHRANPRRQPDLAAAARALLLAAVAGGLVTASALARPPARPPAGPAVAAPNLDWSLFGAPSIPMGAAAPLIGGNRVRLLLNNDIRVGTPAQRSWDILLKTLRFQAQRNQLRLVNRFVNSQRYDEDRALYGVDDHWASVSEFLSRGGDCEDFAIAKFNALLAAGFPEQDLRILVVDDMLARAPHAVVAARLGGVSWILDNQHRDPVPADHIDAYRPLYSFNSAGLWLHRRDSPNLPLPRIVTTTRSR